MNQARFVHSRRLEWLLFLVIVWHNWALRYVHKVQQREEGCIGAQSATKRVLPAGALRAKHPDFYAVGVDRS